MAFSDALADWTDADGAAHDLAVLLGILDPALPFPRTKWIFWTDNRLGNGLHAALLALVDAGVLEMQDDEGQFRWRADFAVVPPPPASQVDQARA